MNITERPIADLFIGGKYVAGHGKPFATVNPATGKTIATIHAASAEDMVLAVNSARKGQKIWAAMSGMQRMRILQRAVGLLREYNDELAYLETLDTGKPLSETKYVDIVTGADAIEYYAGLAPIINGEQIPINEQAFVYTRREPLGICAGIGAWNYPIQIACWKSAPALATGNAMIFKPSEVTPLTALKLAEIYHEAGVPAGVFNVVQGAAEVGEMLTHHPSIEKVSFTGEVGTGKKIAAAATGTNLKEVTLELGGKSPLIIFADANLENAVSAALMANFYSTGQVCTNGTRVFVEASIKAEFEARIKERVAAIRVGDPLDESVNMGPLVSFEHQQKVLHYMQLGKEEGARLLCGGNQLTNGDYAQGAYVEATVFTDCHDEMRIVQDEIFGPVMSILSFATEEEVIRRANNTHYGLAAGVFTENLSRAHRVMQQIEAGICWINNYNLSPVEMPVGGYKQSGIGRENGLETLAHYTQTKSIYVELGNVDSVF